MKLKIGNILSLLCISLLTLLSFSTPAASFECDKATSTDETAICSHHQFNAHYQHLPQPL